VDQRPSRCLRNVFPLALIYDFRVSCFPAKILATLLVAAWVGTAGAQAAPSLTAQAHQVRTPAEEPFSPVPLWDTTWWVSVQAKPGRARLDQLEFHARFTDHPDPRRRAGSITLSEADRDGFSGRVLVVCPTRPDYHRPLRVRLRLRDADGVESEWVDVTFPVRGAQARVVTSPADDVPVATTAETERQHEPLGDVEVEVSNDATIAEVRAALQQQAYARGGHAIVHFRLASSTDTTNTFTADVIRYLEPTPVPAGAPPDDERVIAEIIVPQERR
jgi:hypothetical protein